MNARKAAILAASLVAAAFILWRAADWAYFAPRRQLTDSLASVQSRIDAFQRALEQRRSVSQGLAELASSTLGARPDEVTHRFRSALTTIASDAGLADVKVTSATPRPVPSPAYKKTPAREINAILRNQQDFHVITGQLSARGSLQQVLAAMATVAAQPWGPRIDSFSIAPADKDRKVFDLSLKVAAQFFPDAPGVSDRPLTIAALPPDAADAWAPILAANPFAPPTPPAPRARPQGPRNPPPPPPPPYDQWRIAGIVNVPGRDVEVWLVNQRTGEHTYLVPGQRILDAALLSASFDRAVFEIDQVRYEVLLNQTLDQRRRIDG